MNVPAPHVMPSGYRHQGDSDVIGHQLAGEGRLDALQPVLLRAFLFGDALGGGDHQSGEGKQDGFGLRVLMHGEPAESDPQQRHSQRQPERAGMPAKGAWEGQDRGLPADPQRRAGLVNLAVCARQPAIPDRYAAAVRWRSVSRRARSAEQRS